ncbi:MAG: PEP-CTERM sorting domain-containing protein [Crocosphaera sp.]|nr:PEP-CTERM sorting domain-containing protein [Crocosphaera sp.]
MKNLISKLKVILLTLGVYTGVVGFPNISEAAIIWGDALTDSIDCESVGYLVTCGQIEYYSKEFYPPIPPYSDSGSGYEVPEFNNVIYAFDEKQGVLLEEDVRIAKPNPSYVENEFFANLNPDPTQVTDSDLAYDWDAPRSTMPILSAGTLVDSHFLAFLGKPGDGKREFASAVVKFDNPIIGFIDTRDSDFTNHIFSHTQYDISASRTLEGLRWTLGGIHTRDYVKVSEDNPYILEIKLTTFDAFEGVRVLTQASFGQAVPEPLTILGAGTAIAMGGFFKSKVKSKTKKAKDV